MEQTALRPKPVPDQQRPARPRPGSGPRPHAARRRGRRLRALLFGLFAGTVLVLSGVGLGAVGATAVGTGKLAQLQRQAPHRHPSSTPVTPATAPGPAAPVGATLGVEAVDAEKAGARIIAVHEPGPGHAAGLARGDVILQFGPSRIDTAADLARAVSRARPGERVALGVRHDSGGYQQMTVVPGVVT
ncbi:PDZ domain-containing protein [Streptomyces sp. NPDC001508]|uniref:PDZ domain-containing protein n=1 Tax=Streptomyces sp. NPDC001508 TaxID=3154656 RepID=UPI0033348D0D